MSRDDPRVRLRHMLVYATEAVKLMRDRRRAHLDIDRALSPLCGNCRRSSQPYSGCNSTASPKYPWAQIIAMRNRLIHGYDIVDYDIVWSTVSEDLPPLIAELEKMLSPEQ
jgi:hypothetical protein